MADEHRDRPCPWWLGYVLVNPLRRLFQNPRRVLDPFVFEGMTILEPGCGMGFFTLDLARMVGAEGRVIAVDLQARMLAGLERRARRAGLLDRVEVREATPDRLGLDGLAGRVDLAVAIYMVHELADRAAFFGEVYRALTPEGRLLVIEPRSHGGGDEGFEESVEFALREGFRVGDRPVIGSNQTVLLVK